MKRESRVKMVTKIFIVSFIFILFSSVASARPTEESFLAYQECLSKIEKKCEMFLEKSDCAGECGGKCWRNKKIKDARALGACMDKCWLRCNEPNRITKCYNRKSSKCLRLLVEE